MTFDPTSGEVLCVTLPKDHCVQVPWEYIKVCGYSDHYCKNLDQRSLTLDDLWPHICWGLMGGTTLNQLPIGLHVKILNFNGRFEAYWATFGMLSWYQSIQNRWKFNICFNVWVVVGIVFVVRERKQRPSCFWPDFKPQTAIPPLRIIRDYFRHRNNILFFCVFKFICSPYIIISYITSRYLLFNSPKRGQNISKKHCFEGLLPSIPPNVEGFSVVPPLIIPNFFEM